MNTGLNSEHPWFVPIGGFLAAGKTTLLCAAAQTLVSEGHRVAAILNDQGNDLVDTALVRGSGLTADQVTGGCFCCRFSDLLEAAGGLAKHHPAYGVLRPVTPYAAVLLAGNPSPMTLEGTNTWVLRAPGSAESVVVDPGQARAALAAHANPDIAFLFRNQVEEADLICFSKCDRETEFPGLPTSAPVRYLSAIHGRGVSAWLHEILSGRLACGRATLNIDYQRYARAEAALGWLNYHARLCLKDPIMPALIAGPLFDSLQRELERKNVRIVHLKVIDQAESGYVKAAVSGCGQEPIVEGAVDASPAWEHELVVNLRAVAAPERIREIVADSVKALPGSKT